ncbi:MAG TPA: coiled coil domain-containing protein [Polyangia bacterium]|jgi:3-methyladenine DNA glycosylase AlkC
MVATERNLEKIDAQLQRWSVKIDELVARAASSGARVVGDQRQRIDELKAKRAAAQARLDELRAAGSWKWRRFGGGIARAWNELVVAFRALERQAGG